MRIVVATLQRGRRTHLARQREALTLARRQPDAHVVVSMDAEPVLAPGSNVLHLPIADGAELPLAAARNLAVDHAVRAHRADLVVLLDVDCLPSRELVDGYARAAARSPEHLVAGAVHYLPPGVPAAGAALPTPAELAAAPPHPARPIPAPGELLDEPRVELFWSLSFAVTPTLHRRIGGFDERYLGYGAEDTDYARRAAEAGVGLRWVGGAAAYHQHHPVSSPPVEHLEAIVRNARRFHSIWGDWPMEGWLAAFAERGLVEWDGDRLELVAGDA